MTPSRATAISGPSGNANPRRSPWPKPAAARALLAPSIRCINARNVSGARPGARMARASGARSASRPIRATIVSATGIIRASAKGARHGGSLLERIASANSDRARSITSSHRHTRQTVTYSDTRHRRAGLPASFFPADAPVILGGKGIFRSRSASGRTGRPDQSFRNWMARESRDEASRIERDHANVQDDCRTPAPR